MKTPCVILAMSHLKPNLIVCVPVSNSLYTLQASSNQFYLDQVMETLT